MSPVADNLIVPDRELEEEKKPSASDGFGSLWITDYKAGLLSRIPIEQLRQEEEFPPYVIKLLLKQTMTHLAGARS